MPCYAYIDTNAQPSAPLYYETFRREHIAAGVAPVTVDAVRRLPRMTLHELLTAIVRDFPEAAAAGAVPAGERCVIIVCHGRQEGLSIGLMTPPGADSTAPRARVEALTLLAAPDRPPAEVASMLSISAADVTTLRTKINQVRRLELNRLEFRACRIGEYEDVLEQLRRIFHARSAGAPSVRDTFGTLSEADIALPPPGIRGDSEAFFERWNREHASARRFDLAEGATFLLYTSDPGPEGHHYSVAAAASSVAAVQTWINSFIGAGLAWSPGVAIPYHGFWVPPVSFPGDSGFYDLLRRAERPAGATDDMSIAAALEGLNGL